MPVTGVYEAGHTEIQPLLCRVVEAVAVMTRLSVQVVSCFRQIRPEKLCNCR